MDLPLIPNDFDIWNSEKQKVHLKENFGHIYFKEREIWWCHLGLNIGHEQNGKGITFLRPMLVIKKFNRHTFVALPLTTVKRVRSYLIDCKATDEVFRQAAISQIRSIDIKRLHEKITTVSEDSFLEIRKAVKELF